MLLGIVPRGAMVEETAPVAQGVLRVRPTPAWLRAGGRDAHDGRAGIL
jgi:hypothetical protein